jgi:hypothetical protein
VNGVVGAENMLMTGCTMDLNPELTLRKKPLKPFVMPLKNWACATVAITAKRKRPEKHFMMLFTASQSYTNCDQRAEVDPETDVAVATNADANAAPPRPAPPRPASGVKQQSVKAAVAIDAD